MHPDCLEESTTLLFDSKFESGNLDMAVKVNTSIQNNRKVTMNMIYTCELMPTLKAIISGFISQ